MTFKDFNSFKEELCNKKSYNFSKILFSNDFVTAYMDYQFFPWSNKPYTFKFSIRDGYFEKIFDFKDFQIEEIEILYNKMCKKLKTELKKIAKDFLK